MVREGDYLEIKRRLHEAPAIEISKRVSNLPWADYESTFCHQRRYLEDDEGRL